MGGGGSAWVEAEDRGESLDLPLSFALKSKTLKNTVKKTNTDEAVSCFPMPAPLEPSAYTL